MYTKQIHNNGIQSIWFEENGFRYAFTDEHLDNRHYQAYLAWLAEGNEATEWEGN